MKTGAKLFFMIIVMGLTALAAFALTAYFYKLPVLNDSRLLLYGGAGSGLLALITGLLVAFIKDPRSKAAPLVPDNRPLMEAGERSEQLQQHKEKLESDLGKLSQEVSEFTDAIPAVTETEEPVDKTMVYTIIDEDETDEAGQQDLTMVMPTMEPQPVTSEPAVIRTPKVELTSPLGPQPIDWDISGKSADHTRTLEEKVVETEEEPVTEEPQQVPTADREQWLQADMNPNELSVTQQNYIRESESSYVNEEGMPQFRITKEIPRITVEEQEITAGRFMDYDEPGTPADKWGRVLNVVMTIMFVALALLLIFIAYNKFFG